MRVKDVQDRIYEHGDKMGKLIAWLEKRQWASRLVPELREGTSNPITDPQQIADCFADYYQTISRTEGQYTKEDNRALLRDIKLPTLSKENTSYLESDITVGEVTQAIRTLHSGKASGPNGLPIELYKLAPEVIAPHLHNMFLTSKELGELPPDQRMANIVVVLKPNKVATSCSSYRPISLLNAESKVLAKLLAISLVKIITTIVHPDQSGFMPHRNTALNLWRLHGVLAGATKMHEPAALVSLDAAMAFDMVEWPYLFATLDKLGFGPNFVSWIRLLYTEP